MHTILKGGVVVNLDGGPSEQQDLVIEGEQIASVGTAEAQAGDNVVDVSGMYLLPGLSNCHVHLGWDGTHDLEDQANESAGMAPVEVADLAVLTYSSGLGLSPSIPARMPSPGLTFGVAQPNRGARLASPCEQPGRRVPVPETRDRRGHNAGTGER